MSTIQGRLERLEKTRGTPDAISVTVDEAIEMALYFIWDWMPEDSLDAETTAAIEQWKAGAGDSEALKSRLWAIALPRAEELHRLDAERERTHR